MLYILNFSLFQVLFCHDFQNSKCTRKTCKFLHCPREVENEYHQSGYLPPYVREQMIKLGMSADGPANVGRVPVCKDNLSGKCARGVRCKFRHISPREYDIEMGSSGWGYGNFGGSAVAAPQPQPPTSSVPPPPPPSTTTTSSASSGVTAAVTTGLPPPTHMPTLPPPLSLPPPMPQQHHHPMSVTTMPPPPAPSAASTSSLPPLECSSAVPPPSLVLTNCTTQLPGGGAGIPPPPLQHPLPPPPLSNPMKRRLVEPISGPQGLHHLAGQQDTIIYLQQENHHLHIQLQDLERKVADLTAANEFLLEQNTKLRLGSVPPPPTHIPRPW